MYALYVLVEPLNQIWGFNNNAFLQVKFTSFTNGFGNLHAKTRGKFSFASAQDDIYIYRSELLRPPVLVFFFETETSSI